MGNLTGQTERHSKANIMDFTQFILYAAVFFLSLKLIQYGMIAKLLLGLRFKKAQCQVCSPEEIPAHIQGLFEHYAAELQRKGFEFHHGQILDEFLVTAYSRRWNMVYFQPQQICYACISVSPVPEPASPVRIEYVSFFSDGEKLLTVNGISHEIPGKIPRTHLVDPYAESEEQQYQAHQNELSRWTQTKSTISLTPEEYVSREESDAIEYLEYLVTQECIKKSRDGYWQWKLVPALRQAYRSLQGLRRVRQMQLKQRKNQKAPSAISLDVPVEVECEAFWRAKDLSESRYSGFGAKVFLFLFSLTIFLVIFRFALSLELLPILVVVLIVHELGHVVGMYLFGYKDVQVLFLPFGAATLGTQTNASVLQKVIVYLLGPAPGIIIGTICMVCDSFLRMEILKQTGLFLLILNYLNLLPILPLDGGRVFELTLFSRAHFLKSGFMIVSTIALAIAGFYSGDSFLFVFALFLGLGSRTQISQNRVLSRLEHRIQAEHLERNENTLVPAIFQLLKENPYGAMPFQRKLILTKYLLQHSTTPPASVSVIVTSMLLYLLAWLLPLIAIIAFAIIGFVQGLREIV